RDCWCHTSREPGDSSVCHNHLHVIRPTRGKQCGPEMQCRHVFKPTGQDGPIICIDITTRQASESGDAIWPGASIAFGTMPGSPRCGRICPNLESLNVA